MVALEMLIRLKQIGKRFNFDIKPDVVWRICLWHSLGEEVVKVVEESAEQRSEKRVECWMRVSTLRLNPNLISLLRMLQTSKHETRAQVRPMLLSEVYTFIHKRIRFLSEMTHNQGGPGASTMCRKEIEETINDIWKIILEKDGSAEISVHK
jgi:hypothetical protein